MKTPLKILFASAEVTPIAKVGGLADVAGALPKALAHHDVDVRIIMPKYDVIDEREFPMTLFKKDLPVQLGNETVLVNLYTYTLPDSSVPVLLIDSKKFFNHGSIYFEKSTFVGGISEIDRFTFFSKAVVDLIPQLDWPVDILHCQDWHTGLLPALKDLADSSNQDTATIKTLYTIHNLSIQGLWTAKHVYDFLGLDPETSPVLKQQDKEGNINLIEQGILSADYVNTVSPTYAKEIRTAQFGLGLEKRLQDKYDDKKFIGILNGIDVKRFDPATDPAIAKNYSSKDPTAKAINKAALQKWAGLAIDPAIPVIGSVGRLFEQKGLDLVPTIAEKLFKNDVQLIVLGSGLEEQEQAMRALEKRYPQQVKTVIGFVPKLSQEIYAGADLFLMPSRFEPCGLGQMIAMRYGTPPIVNATGGLKDTVIDVTKEGGTGFVFNEPKSAALLEAISHGLSYFKNKESWQALVKNCMRQDFSWDHSSLEYLKLYQSLVQ